MGDVLGKIFGVVLAFILCILAPLTVAVMSDDMTDRRAIYSEMTDFVDEVVDTAQITPEQLSDFYAGISAYGPVCEVQVFRYMRTAEPGVDRTYDITYIPLNVNMSSTDTTYFNTGDMIKIHVEAVGYRGMQKTARGLLGGFLQPIEYSVVARVR